MRGNKSVSIGVDLAGSELRNTGIASLDSSLKLEHGVLHRDREVIQYASNSQPDVIVIDAPLSLPRGRESLEKKSNIHFRECDVELRRRHIPFFPLTLGPMRKLTARGINLVRILRLEGYNVFEGYPGAAHAIMKIPRKAVSQTQLAGRLRKLGLD